MLKSLKAINQWVVWREEEGRKVPYDAKTGRRASSTNPRTWVDYEQAKASYEGDPSIAGVGFVFTENDGLVGIDVDKCVGDGELNEIGRYVYEQFCGTYIEFSPSGKGLHVIGWATKMRGMRTKDDSIGLEVYDRGRFFTVTFEQLEDVNDDVGEMQEALELLTTKYLYPRTSGSRNQERGMADIPVFTEGGRDTGLFQAAVSMYHKGVPKGMAYAAIERLADACQPPFDREQARRKVDSAWKSEDPHPGEVIKRLNEKYAMLGDGSVLCEPIERGELPSMQKYEGVKRAHANQKVRYEDAQGNVRTENQFVFWTSHPERRSYDRIVFKPNGGREVDYNMFQGFKVKPEKRPKGSCEMFLRHIKENVCREEPDMYDFVLDWFAGILRDPGGGPRTALVLIGGQGTGKTVVAEYLKRIIGEAHFKTFSHSEHFVSKFNTGLALSIVAHAEEATWGGHKKDAGALKSLITDQRIRVEPKGQDQYEVDNNVHLLITSNERWPVPIEADDRRFVVLNLGKAEERASDEFFEGLFEELDEKNGPERLYWYLTKEREVKSTNPKVPRRTKAHGEVVNEGLSPFEQVVLGWVERNDMGIAGNEWKEVVGFNSLYEAYYQEAMRLRGSVISKHLFAKRLMDMFDGQVVKERQRSENAVRKKHGLPEREDDSDSSVGVREATLWFVFPCLKVAEQIVNRKYSGISGG